MHPISFCHGFDIPLKHRIHPKSFFNDLTSETQVFKRKGTCHYKLDVADIESVFMVFRLGHWCENSEPKLVKCPNNDLFVMYCGRVD